MSDENINERLLRTERERDAANRSYDDQVADTRQALRERDEATKIAATANAEAVRYMRERDEAIRERDAELALLRAAANERAIAELEEAERYLRRAAGLVETGRASVTEELRKCAAAMRQRVDGLRAEQQAAPVPPPVTPPADAPSRPGVGQMERLRDDIHESWRRDRNGPNEIDQLQRAVKLLLDDALAGRGEGAK